VRDAELFTLVLSIIALAGVVMGYGIGYFGGAAGGRRVPVRARREVRPGYVRRTGRPLPPQRGCSRFDAH
jgi:membrane protein DedA with SNARE-associated domain